MDDGDATLECLAARLWDRQKEMDLDLEELSYSMCSARSNT